MRHAAGLVCHAPRLTIPSTHALIIVHHDELRLPLTTLTDTDDPGDDDDPHTRPDVLLETTPRTLGVVALVETA